MADNRNNSRKAPPKIRIPVNRPIRSQNMPPVPPPDAYTLGKEYNYLNFFRVQPPTPFFTPRSKQRNINRTHALARRISENLAEERRVKREAAELFKKSGTLTAVLGQRGAEEVARELDASRSFFAASPKANTRKSPKKLSANVNEWVPSHVAVEEALAAAAKPSAYTLWKRSQEKK